MHRAILVPCVLACLASLFVSHADGASPAFPPTMESDAWHVIDAGSFGITVRWESPPIETEVFSRDGVRYVRLLMAGAGTLESPGSPAVPVMRALIRVPTRGIVSASAEHEAPAVRGVAAFGASRVAPVPRRVPKVPGASPEDAWLLDAASYEARTPRAGSVSIRPVGVMRGVRLALVEFYPVCYDPAASTVEIVPDATIRIVFDSPLEDPDPRLARSWFSRHAEQLVLNPPARAVVGLPAGYLIVTTDSLYDAILPLAAWKTRKGFPATVTKLSQIPGGPTANNIKTYIQNAYQTWDPPPEFVLLIGDTNTIPAWNGSGYQNPPNDLYYSCMDAADWVPDLYLGRFSLRTIADIQGLVEKTVDYEQAAWSVDSLWAGREYFVSSDDPSYHGVTEGTHQYCMAKARAHGVVCDSLWGFYGTGTPIATAVNGGRAVFAYSGHGVEASWQGPTFSRWNVDQLANLDKYPIVLSFACLTGNFAWSGDQDCLMERWIRRPDKAAVVAYGSSVSSFWDDDDYLQRRMWDALFDADFNWVGGFVLEGKLRYKQGFGTNTYTKGYFEQYNILGDPSLLMYTLAPTPLAVTHPPSIPAGTAQVVSVTVLKSGSPCADALVCLHKNGEVQVASYTDAAGQASLGIPAATPGSLDITVTAYNGIAFLGTIVVAGGGDTEPPSTPAWATLNASSGLLTWAPATDNVGVTGYRVYRSSLPYFQPSPGLLYAAVPSTSADVSGSLGNPAVNYTFRVTAVDAASNESSASPPVGESDFELTVPSASESFPVSPTAE